MNIFTSELYNSTSIPFKYFLELSKQIGSFLILKSRCTSREIRIITVIESCLSGYYAFSSGKLEHIITVKKERRDEFRCAKRMLIRVTQVLREGERAVKGQFTT